MSVSHARRRGGGASTIRARRLTPPEVSGERLQPRRRARSPSSEPSARRVLLRCPRAWGHGWQPLHHLRGAIQHQDEDRGAPIAMLGEPAAPALCETASKRCRAVDGRGRLATMVRQCSGSGPPQVLNYAPFCFSSSHGSLRGVSDRTQVHKMLAANCDRTGRAPAC